MALSHYQKFILLKIKTSVLGFLSILNFKNRFFFALLPSKIAEEVLWWQSLKPNFEFHGIKWQKSALFVPQFLLYAKKSSKSMVFSSSAHFANILRSLVWHNQPYISNLWGQPSCWSCVIRKTESPSWDWEAGEYIKPSLFVFPQVQTTCQSTSF